MLTRPSTIGVISDSESPVNTMNSGIKDVNNPLIVSASLFGSDDDVSNDFIMNVLIFVMLKATSEVNSAALLYPSSLE